MFRSLIAVAGHWIDPLLAGRRIVGRVALHPGDDEVAGVSAAIDCELVVIDC